MKRLFTLVFTLCLMSLAVQSFALPTDPHRKLKWDPYTDAKGTGFFLYYAGEADSPREYTDQKKIDVGKPSSEEVVLIDLNPPPPNGDLCFKLTAYDAQGRESDFSNEACGFFGLTVPTGLLTTE